MNHLVPERDDGGASEVVFLLLGEPALEKLAGLEPDAAPGEFRRGERAWILQTFLHLRRAGHPVRLGAELPERGLVVYHAKQRREVARLPGRRRDVVLVAVRGDLRPVRRAAFEIVQCGGAADGRRAFAMPHWTQPGLRPRDPARGDRVERVAFKGFAGNLHPQLRGPGWRRTLAERGFEWVEDATEFTPLGALAPLAWEDFSDVDALVALRPAARLLGRDKPPSKLVNAWLAGVPAILGPEPAFRELRRSPLDYLEAATPEEALSALERLRADPGLCRAMVENGWMRARDYSRETLVARWVELLFATLPERLGAGDPRPGRAVWGRRLSGLLDRARGHASAPRGPR